MSYQIPWIAHERTFVFNDMGETETTDCEPGRLFAELVTDEAEPWTQVLCTGCGQDFELVDGTLKAL